MGGTANYSGLVSQEFTMPTFVAVFTASHTRKKLLEGKNNGNFVQKGDDGKGVSLTSSEDVLSTSRGGAGRTGGEWCCGDVGGDACSCRGDPGDVGLQHNDVIHNVIRRTSCGA